MAWEKMSSVQRCICSPALGPGAREHDAAYELRPDQRELLRDEAADRVAEHVDLVKLERVEKAQRVWAIALNVRGVVPPGDRAPPRARS